MNRMQRAAVLLMLLDEMKTRGSWCGETHLQKATYFLQELLRVPLGFQFILYKHGPYSFDLNDEITALRADLLLSVKLNPPYGPSLMPAPGAEAIHERFPRTIREQRGAIQFVAERLAKKNVSELEKLATALFVTRNEMAGDAESRARKIHELKPHVRLEEARTAVQIADEIIAAARELAA